MIDEVEHSGAPDRLSIRSSSTGQSTTASGLETPPIIIHREDGDHHRCSVTDRDSYSGVVAAWHDTDGAERRDVIAGNDDNPKRLRPIYASEDNALAEARVEWQRLQRGVAEFSLTLAEGRPDIYPEAPARCVGWEQEIEEAEWLLTEVRHDIGDSGYSSTLRMELDRRAYGDSSRL